MIQMRPSVPGDVPQLRQLWKLAFGDDDSYIDHFFRQYYAPERVLVLLEDGDVRAMTAWFDTVLDTADGNRWRAAYLYAVATHPDCRGRGLAGGLLKYADFYLREEQHFQCVTTVPARPDLHVFFGANDFRECFVLGQREYRPGEGEKPSELTPVDGTEYGAIRERFLSGTVHVAYARPALEYQAGTCALSGGGLYRVGEAGCLCAERGEEGLVVKELLVPREQEQAALEALARRLPAPRYWVRTPWRGEGEPWQFAMLKWLYPGLEERWDWTKTAYLGLAFD